MKLYFYLIAILSIFNSCTPGTIELNNKLSYEHFFIENTNVALRITDEFERVRGVNGVQNVNELWLISVKTDYRTLEKIKTIYSEKNFDLRNSKSKMKKEIIERQDVTYNNDLSGFWVKYFDEARRRYRYQLSIDQGDKRTHIQAWVSQKEEVYKCN